MKNDDFFDFLVATDQLDDFLGLEEGKTNDEQNKENFNEELEDDNELESNNINDEGEAKNN